MLNVSASSVCFSNRRRRPLRSGTWTPSGVRNGGRIGITRLFAFCVCCIASESGKMISNSYTVSDGWVLITSRIVRGVEKLLVSKYGMKRLFNVVLDVNE